ncbi:PREDICTED: U11/U12 small nuclear ribonucleoprotein 48 kDa protein [Ipomoea nil]|uniref:U11/U12 small nuclear ribonucleoprotein 48 kDa protein n=1 Tax=Ipomoea nil TaxID=35883 RepID=UPI0009015D75|nr:PREDICTED: U11/U12 small nuclear ribonucleoprotein 48 kDa protein [Ipomoea nil]
MNPSAPLRPPPLQPPPVPAPAPSASFHLLPPAPPSSTGFNPPPQATNSAPRIFFSPGFHIPPTAAAASDIPAALSALTSLLRLSQTTLDSLSSILPATSAPSPPTTLVPCPFNPTHRLPPPSLFRHTLHCLPSSSSASLDSLIQSRRYPHTLRSSAQGNDVQFTHPLHDPQAELCFSLESYFDHDQDSFFYSNCPGVVSFPGKDPSPPMLILPGFLLSHCSNSQENCIIDLKEFHVSRTQLLPSEIYAIRVEVHSWNDYPCSYSYRILRAILRLEMSSLCSLPSWLIANSPKYGVVIDEAMSNHIVLLCKLCLKAIVSESVGLANAPGKQEGDKESVSSDRRLECPILVRVLMWLASQLSVLYGEMNGRLFAINILRQCILDYALKSSSFFSGLQQATLLRELNEVNKEHEEPLESSKSHESRKENNGNDVEGGTLSKSMVSVSQVAAAVAALHERSILEGKIRKLQDTWPVSVSQRNVEHAYVAKTADEERQKRPNYKAVIDHDGLLWQRSHNNQETNKMKTREELLAEERDYKRRRMSYRGKKVKRSTTQVMRDIIEEYMEDIRQAGGVDCLTKGEEAQASISGNSSMQGLYRDDAKSIKNKVDSSLMREQSHHYMKGLHSHREAQSSDFRDDSSKESTRDRSHHSHGTVVADRSVGKNGRSRRDYSRSPDRLQSSTYTSKQASVRRKHDDQEAYKEDFSHSSSRKHQKSHDRKSPHRERIERNLDPGKRRRRETYQDRRSGSALCNEFEDRYNPSESHDIYEDNV